MTTTYSVGDDLYCYSEKDRLPYEAKITAIKEHKGAQKYFVHYKGWNVRYDEKVPVDQIEGKLFKTLADYKPPATNGASSEPSTSTSAAPAAPKAKPAASGAKAAVAAAKPKSPAKAAPKPAAKAKTEPAPSSKPTRKAAAPASQPQTSAASSSSQEAYAFALHEECVCLRGGEPCEAKVMAIKDHHGHMRYTISYKGLSAKHNDHVRVGSEKDRMFKGNLKEYREKHPEAASSSSSDGASTSATPSAQEPTTTRQKRAAAAASAAEPTTSEAEEEKTAAKKSKKN